MQFTQTLLQKLLDARESGATLREAADAAGVHVATVCRWQKRDPDFAKKMREAKREARRLHYSMNHGPRPNVPWRRDCPWCKARVVVRTANGGLRF